MAQQALKSESKGNKVIKAGLGYVVSQLIVKGASFICTPFFSRLLGVELYGEVKIYESWLQIFLPIFTLSLYTSIERAKYQFKGELDNYVSSVQTLIMITIGLLLLASIPFLGIITSILKMNAAAFITILLYCMTNAAILLYQRRVKLDYRYKTSMALSLLTTLPALAISLLAVLYGRHIGDFENLANYRNFGMYWPQVCVGLFIIGLLIYKGKTLCKKEYWSFALRFSIPLIPSLVSVSILNQSDKIMIEAMCGKYATGIFSMASNLMYVLYVIETAIGDAWLPWLFEKLNSKEYDQLQKPWLMIIILAAVMSWACILFAPEFILILGGKEYVDAKYLIAPVVSGALFHFFTFSYINIEKFFNSTRTVAVASVSAMIVNLIMNYFGIKMFGYQAAAYTTVICYLLIMLLHAFMVKYICGEYIISLKNTLVVSLTVVILNLLTLYTFDFNFFIRIIIFVVVMMGVMYALWKVFNVSLKDMKKILKR